MVDADLGGSAYTTLPPGTPSPNVPAMDLVRLRAIKTIAVRVLKLPEATGCTTVNSSRHDAFTQRILRRRKGLVRMPKNGDVVGEICAEGVTDTHIQDRQRAKFRYHRISS